MSSPTGPGKKDVLSKKEEFFRNLNLLATKRVKVKYCRTIKERLRASTIEESLALPKNATNAATTKTLVASSSLQSTPTRRRPEVVKFRGGLSLIKSFKKRKSARLRKAMRKPPSTKSLLSYLQPKQATESLENPENEDSSSVESDSNTEAGEPVFRLKQISVSVSRLSSGIQLLAAESAVEEDNQICGFSNEISEKTFSKNEQLKNLISDLESDISEKEREGRRERVLSGTGSSQTASNLVGKTLPTLTVASFARPDGGLRLAAGSGPGTTKSSHIRLKIVEDFGIVSETESEEELGMSRSLSLRRRPPTVVKPHAETEVSGRIKQEREDVEEEEAASFDEYSEVGPPPDRLVDWTKAEPPDDCQDKGEMCWIYDTLAEIKPPPGLITAVGSPQHPSRYSQESMTGDPVRQEASAATAHQLRQEATAATDYQLSQEAATAAAHQLRQEAVEAAAHWLRQEAIEAAAHQQAEEATASLQDGEQPSGVKDDELSATMDSDARPSSENSHRTRSVTPLGSRITIKRTMGIQTPPRSKRQLDRAVKPRRRPGSLEAGNMAARSSPTPGTAAKAQRSSSADHLAGSVSKVTRAANRLISRKAHELKAQRRRDKYQELFLRQQALALERLTRMTASPVENDAGKMLDSDEEKDGGEEINEMAQEEERRTKENQEAEIKIDVKEEWEVAELTSVSDLLDSQSESEHSQYTTGGHAAPCISPEMLPSTVGDNLGQGTDASSQVPIFPSVQRDSFDMESSWADQTSSVPNCGEVVERFERQMAGKETEIVLTPSSRTAGGRKSSSGQRAQQQRQRLRVVRSLADKVYSAKILAAPVRGPANKEHQPVVRCVQFSELDRDERELEDILREFLPQSLATPAVGSRSANDGCRQRRGEPTFEEPEEGVGELVRRMRRLSRISRGRFALLSRPVTILARHRFWEPHQRDDCCPASLPYKSFTLAPDQISKPTRHSKQFSRLSRPSMADIMQARRLYGILQAAFNYDTEPEATEPKKRPLPHAKLLPRSKRLSASQSKLKPAQARRLLKKKLAAHHHHHLQQQVALLKAGSSREPWPSVGLIEDFNVDSIEALVDNQPVEDENTNDSLVEGVAEAAAGSFSCHSCVEAFPSRSALEYHQRIADHVRLKTFSCPKCGLRFTNASHCIRHQEAHTRVKKYKCEHCPMRFSRKFGLEKHNWTVHTMSVTTQPDSVCVVDPRLAGQSPQSPGQPWSCPQCDARFNKASSLSFHVRNVHDMQRNMRALYHMVKVKKGLQEPARETKSSAVPHEEEAGGEIVWSSPPVHKQPFERKKLATTSHPDSAAQAQTAIQAANKDLDVQLTFVENLKDILSVPNDKLFILEQPSNMGSDATVATNIQQPQRPDLSADDDINKIQQFLGQPLEAAASDKDGPGQVAAVLELSVDVASSSSLLELDINRIEEQPSEDIDEIQKFLERSQIDQSPTAGPASDKGVLKEEQPPSATLTSKYRIPKSPEFKKRFQNKEIVKIVRGTDRHKNLDKVQMSKKVAVAVVKPSAPSFEQQLHEAELVDMRSTLEKKRKWKNKSSTRDYMITKKYAKIVGHGAKAETSMLPSSQNESAVPSESLSIKRSNKAPPRIPSGNSSAVVLNTGTVAARDSLPVASQKPDVRDRKMEVRKPGHAVPRRASKDAQSLPLKAQATRPRTEYPAFEQESSGAQSKSNTVSSLVISENRTALPSTEPRTSEQTQSINPALPSSGVQAVRKLILPRRKRSGSSPAASDGRLATSGGEVSKSNPLANAAVAGIIPLAQIMQPVGDGGVSRPVPTLSHNRLQSNASLSSSRTNLRKFSRPLAGPLPALGDQPGSVKSKAFVIKSQNVPLAGSLKTDQSRGQGGGQVRPPAAGGSTVSETRDPRLAKIASATATATATTSVVSTTTVLATQVVSEPTKIVSPTEKVPVQVTKQRQGNLIILGGGLEPGDSSSSLPPPPPRRPLDLNELAPSLEAAAAVLDSLSLLAGAAGRLAPSNKPACIGKQPLSVDPASSLAGLGPAASLPAPVSKLNRLQLPAPVPAGTPDSDTGPPGLRGAPTSGADRVEAAGAKPQASFPEPARQRYSEPMDQGPGYYTETYQVTGVGEPPKDLPPSLEPGEGAGGRYSSYPTLLPTNFPTFDSPVSSPKLVSGGFHSGGLRKLPAAVPSSKPKLAGLPKPVPAAIAPSGRAATFPASLSRPSSADGL